jgi:hypothetical protein
MSNMGQRTSSVFLSLPLSCLLILLWPSLVPPTWMFPLCSLNWPIGHTCVHPAALITLHGSQSSNTGESPGEVGVRIAWSCKWAVLLVSAASFLEIFFSLFNWSISHFPRALFGVIWHVFHHDSSLYFLTGPSSQCLLSKQRRLQQDWDLQLYWRSFCCVTGLAYAMYFPPVPLNSVYWFLCVIPSIGTIPKSH